MYMSNALQSYPEWYIVESNAARTIQKLLSIKELSIYLRNTNEYVRRLAILRINELSLKDSINILKDMLDDNLESPTNKELAAWTIKCIISKWNIDLFISHRLLNKYTGNEKYNDMFKISIIDQANELKFNFSKSLISSELFTDISDVRSIECPNVEFLFLQWANEWFKTWFCELRLSFKQFLLKLPSSSFTFLKKALPILFLYIVTILSKLFKGSRKKQLRNIIIGSSANDSVYKASVHSLESLRVKDNNYYTARNSIPFKHIKDFIMNSLYILFSPLRLVAGHRKLVAAVFVVAYIYFTFTASGKLFTYKHFGMDIADTQLNAFTSVKEIFSYAVDEAADIADLTQLSDKNIPQSHELPQQLKKYIVMAKTGLNLRKEPDYSQSSTEKILGYNTVVTYLSKSIQDQEGALWYYVQDTEGKSGWVSSKWLKEIGGTYNARE